MDTDSYFHTYKQYKVGTKQVINWLVEKAGYRTTKSTSYKGQNGTTDIPSTILPKLARIAMKSLTSLDVPRNLRTILCQVISARKECAAHHRRKMMDHDKPNQNDLGHEHFIRILEQVNDIIGQTSQSPSATKSQPDSDVRLVNRFEHLELEESLDQEVNVQDTREERETKKVSKIESAASPELQLTHGMDGEGLFAAFCFLMDCHRIRKYLRTVWDDYRSKKISLIAASLTTNMAFDVIAQIHFELSRDFPRFADFEAINEPLFDTNAHQSVKQGNRLSFTVSAGSEAYLVLKQMGTIYKAGHYAEFPELKNDLDWIEDCEKGVPALTPQEKSQRLIRAIPDMLFFILQLGQPHLVDELSSSIFKLYNSYEVDVPMVIACEIFIDIHYTLLADIELPFNRLLETGKDCKIQMQKNAILTDILNANCSSTYTKKACNELKDILHLALENDAVATFRERVVKCRKQNLRPFYILRHHPVLCGMLDFNISRIICYLGVRMSMEWECVTAVAHLYKALRQHGNLLIDWADMDVYLSFYSKSIFKDMPYSSPADWVKQIGLALGVSSPTSNYNSRTIVQDDDGVFSTYKKSQPSLQPVLCNEMQPLLTIMEKRHDIKQGKKSAGMVLREAVQAISSSESNKGVQILEEWNTLGQLSPIHTLEAILYGVQRDELHLYFDFMSFNRRCIQLLRRLRNTLIEKFPDIPIPELALRNEHINLIVMFVFLIAGDVEKHYLTVAGEVVRNTIEREGDKEKTKMSGMSWNPTG